MAFFDDWNDTPHHFGLFNVAKKIRLDDILVWMNISTTTATRDQELQVGKEQENDYIKMIFSKMTKTPWQ